MEINNECLAFAAGVFVASLFAPLWISIGEWLYLKLRGKDGYRKRSSSDEERDEGC